MSVPAGVITRKQQEEINRAAAAASAPRTSLRIDQKRKAEELAKASLAQLSTISVSKRRPRGTSVRKSISKKQKSKRPTIKHPASLVVQADPKIKDKVLCADSVHDLFGIADIGNFQKYGACGSIWGYMAELVRFGTLYHISKVLKPYIIRSSVSKFATKGDLARICTEVIGVPSSKVEDSVMKTYASLESVSISQSTIYTKANFKNSVKNYTDTCYQLFPALRRGTDIHMGYDAGIGPLAKLFEKIVDFAKTLVKGELTVVALKRILIIAHPSKHVPILYLIKMPQNIADSANDVHYPEFLTIYEFPATSGSGLGAIFEVDSNIFTLKDYKIFYRKKQTYNNQAGKHQFEYVIQGVWGEYVIDYGLNVGDLAHPKYITSGPSLGTLAAHYLHKALDKSSFKNLTNIEESATTNIKQNILAHCEMELRKILEIFDSPSPNKRDTMRKTFLELQYTILDETSQAYPEERPSLLSRITSIFSSTDPIKTVIENSITLISQYEIISADKRKQIEDLIENINELQSKSTNTKEEQIDTISIKGTSVYSLFIEKTTVPLNSDESIEIQSPLTIRMMDIIRTTLPYILGNKTVSFSDPRLAYQEVYRSYKGMMDSKHHLGKINNYEKLNDAVFLDIKRDGDRSQVKAICQLWKERRTNGYHNMLFVSHDRLCCTQMCLEGGPVPMWFGGGGNYKLVRCNGQPGCKQSGGAIPSEEMVRDCSESITLGYMLNVVAMKASQLVEACRQQSAQTSPLVKEALYIDMFHEIVDYIQSISSIDTQDTDKAIEPFFEKLIAIRKDKTEGLHLHIIDRLHAYYRFLPYIKDAIGLQYAVSELVQPFDTISENNGFRRATMQEQIPAYLLNRNLEANDSLENNEENNNRQRMQPIPPYLMNRDPNNYYTPPNNEESSNEKKNNKNTNDKTRMHIMDWQEQGKAMQEEKKRQQEQKRQEEQEGQKKRKMLAAGGLRKTRKNIRKNKN